MTEDKERKSTELLFWSWGHGLQKRVLTIRELVEFTKRNLASTSYDLDQIVSRLDMIDQLSAEIMETPSPFELEHVSVNLLIQELIERLQKRDFFHQMTFEVDLDPKQPFVSANPVWLRRVIEILIDNAVEAMDELAIKKIDVSTHINQAEVTIAVRDRGKGIERNILSGIFQTPLTPRPGGKGRGLYIAQLAVELYGGKIEIDTTSKGTTIFIQLPVCDKEVTV
jgi:signal transduction histidine kinase